MVLWHGGWPWASSICTSNILPKEPSVKIVFLDCFYPCIFTHETYIHIYIYIYIYICINLANCHDILDILNDITQPQHHRCMTFIIRFFRFVLPWPPAVLQSTASGAPRDFSRALRSVKPGGSGDMVVSNMGLFHGKTPQKTSLITVLLGTPILENLRINSRALKNAPKPKSNDSQGRWIGEIHAFHPEIGTKMDQFWDLHGLDQGEPTQVICSD